MDIANDGMEYVSEQAAQVFKEFAGDIEFSSEMEVELVEATLSDSAIASAARASFRVDTDAAFAFEASERDAALIRRLWRDGHGTPFEYPNITIALKVPLFVHNQLVKHRISTINTKSGRYSEFAPKFYLPDDSRKIFQAGKAMDYDMRGDEHSPIGAECRDFLTQHLRSQAVAWTACYKMLLEGGVAKEVARMGMPLNIYTECWVNMNLRSWFNFISLRYHNPEMGFTSHGQAEISDVAKQVLDILRLYYPVAVEAFLEKQGENIG